MPQEDSNLVKKEEVEDEEDGKSIMSTFINRKKKSPSSSIAPLKSEPKVKKEVKEVNKEETDEDLENPISKNSSNKPDKKMKGEVKKMKKEEVEMEKKKNNNNKGGKAGDTDKDTKKRERKVFDLPGQKRGPPEERDPLRIFYETLYKQVPTSEMASICFDSTIYKNALPTTMNSSIQSKTFANIIQDDGVWFTFKGRGKEGFREKNRNVHSNKSSVPQQKLLWSRRKQNRLQFLGNQAHPPFQCRKKRRLVRKL